MDDVARIAEGLNDPMTTTERTNLTNLTRLIDRAKLALGMDLKTRDERLRELTAELERLGYKST